MQAQAITGLDPNFCVFANMATKKPGGVESSGPIVCACRNMNRVGLEIVQIFGQFFRQLTGGLTAFLKHTVHANELLKSFCLKVRVRFVAEKEKVLPVSCQIAG